MFILRATNQKDLIKERKWDYLIILDACRYDYFERIYKDFLKKGNLQKVISPGSCTEEWLKKTFQNENYEDLVYVSSMPHINSKGIDVYDFKSDCFKDVLDVWDFGWNKELETVPPQEVNNGTMRALEKYPHSRMVIHYAQPHGPYLHLKTKEKNKTNHSTEPKPILKWLHAPSSNRIVKSVKHQLKKGIGRRIIREIGQETVWGLREVLGEEPSSLVYQTVKKFGKEKLREAYLKNLEEALKSVSELIPNLEGNIVLTADHGESLGENGSYGHGLNLSAPELREVPWFEISIDEKDKKSNEGKSNTNFLLSREV